MSNLQTKVEEAYQLTTTGKFSDALAAFKGIILQILLTVVDDESQAQQVHQLLATCREYILGLGMELARRDVNVDTDPKRALEMAAYFTHCQLLPIHLSLCIRSAMVLSFKVKNYATAYTFSSRLLEMSPSPQVAQQAKKIQIHCERLNKDEIPLDYDQYNPFTICGISYTPIHRGSPSVSCPYCSCSFKPEYKGSICTICDVSKIGTTGTGLTLFKE